MQPVHRGFYNATIGNDSNTIYGVVQCRGDIPPAACTECKRNAIEDVKNGCEDTKCKVVWYTYCTLQYSSVNFYFYKKNYVATIKNSSILDDQDVALRGYNFMRGLASSTSEQPFMYQYEALDLGQSGKSYGMAQCNNDLNSSACSQCLHDELSSWRTRIGNNREWEIYSVLCSLWYRDYPFSYNVSRLSPSPPNASIGMRRVPFYGEAACALMIMVLALLFAL